ncbi:MAG: hypothetical protein QXT97_03830, partial [Candidatus Diapherotrites archaeon]
MAKAVVFSRVFVFFVLVLFVFVPFVFSVQQLMALHGKAVSSGSPINSGDLRVLIYDANVGGNIVYDSGSDFNGSIINGFFDVMLGSITPLDLNYGQIYYMDILVNGFDLNFSGSDRRMFESSRGAIKSSSILDGSIVNADISVSAAIDWSKISKVGSKLSDLGFDSDFNATYAKQFDVNNWFVKSADANLVFYTQADANNVLLNKVDANFLFGRKAFNETISGSWNFVSPLWVNGGFSSGGITLQNGVGYFQSIVILNDFNAATVTGIDLNGHYLPDPDNMWDLGSALRRFRKIYSVDANFSSALIDSLSLGSPLGVASGGTGASSFVSGGLLFYNGSSIFGDGNLFWDYSAKRLGVGTSLPVASLNVVGDANVTSNFYAGYGLLSVVSSLGRVGIGTLAPQNTLNVVGDLNVTGVSYLGNVIISADDINVNKINSKDGNLVFRSFGSELARLVGTSGNFGIGTNNPSSKLHVVGDVNVTGEAYLDLSWSRLKDYPAGCVSGQFVTAIGDTLTCSNIPGGGGGRTYIGFSPISIDNDANTIALNVLPTSDWNGLFDGFDSNYYLNFKNLVDRNFSLLTLDNNAPFDARYVLVSDTNNVARINYGAIGGLAQGQLLFGSLGVIAQDSNLYWNESLNRLGIGTNQPQNTLNVVGDLNVTGNAFINNVFGFVRDSVFNAAFPVDWDLNVVNKPHIPSGVTIDANIWAVLQSQVPWQDANVSDNITVVGYVRDSVFNATFPLSDANVVDDLTIRSSRDANFWAGLSSNVVSSVDNNDLLFRTNNLTRMVITKDGNVGVGVLVPTSKLDVNGSVLVRNDLNVLGNAYFGNVVGFVRDSVFNAAFPVDWDLNVVNKPHIPSGVTIDANVEAIL